VSSIHHFFELYGSQADGIYTEGQLYARLFHPANPMGT
jgi:hypothetical protein